MLEVPVVEEQLALIIEVVVVQMVMVAMVVLVEQVVVLGIAVVTQVVLVVLVSQVAEAVLAIPATQVHADRMVHSGLVEMEILGKMVFVIIAMVEHLVVVVDIMVVVDHP